MRIGVAGALGRMGAAVAELADALDGFELSALCDQPGAKGEARRPLVSRSELLAASDVVVDFSTPAAASDLAREAAERGGPALVIGPTGFSAEEEAKIQAASRRIAIVKSGNFSLAVNLLAHLVETAASRLGAEAWDIEILETHHRGKRDAPSGTALILGEAAARGRKGEFARLRAPARQGLDQARRSGEIGIASLRGGGVVGEHAVVFAGTEEILTLSHSARDRRLFARGALTAAAWVAGKPPGLYSMADVLGLK
ncbi:MAG: 4-hydroxy-tetrahydrodipicolinate reductase [Caulobacteraceae bacterium]